MARSVKLLALLMVMFVAMCCTTLSIKDFPRHLPSPPVTVHPDPPPGEMTKHERTLDRVIQAYNSLGHNMRCTLTEDETKTVLAKVTTHAFQSDCAIVIHSSNFSALDAISAEAVFAHEVGHADCRGCPGGWAEELYADGFAGCTLAILGYTKEEMNRAAETFGGFTGGSTHPYGHDRELAVRIGYESCRKDLNQY